MSVICKTVECSDDVVILIEGVQVSVKSSVNDLNERIKELEQQNARLLTLIESMEQRLVEIYYSPLGPGYQKALVSYKEVTATKE